MRFRKRVAICGAEGVEDGIAQIFAGHSELKDAYQAWMSAPVLGSIHFVADVPALLITLSVTSLIYVGIKESYHVVKYKLIIGGRSEDQKSSGIIISTPAGSYAWARSAGGRLLPLIAKKIEYVIREPYIGRLTRPRLTQGVLGSNQKITIISEIWDKHEGIVVIDSYKKEFEFNNGSKLVVKAARQPLNLIYF